MGPFWTLVSGVGIVWVIRQGWIQKLLNLEAKPAQPTPNK